jgi:hypothetical protein
MISKQLRDLGTILKNNGHSLIRLPYQCYKCRVCKTYFWVNADIFQDDNILDLSCNEIIIKNIIE